MKRLLATIAVAILGASITTAGEYPDFSVEKLHSAIKKKDVTVIDVNGPVYYKKGHIPGAIDYTANKEKLAKLLPKEKNALIVAYCGGPSCSAYTKAAKAAKDLGTPMSCTSRLVSPDGRPQVKTSSPGRKHKARKRKRIRKNRSLNLLHISGMIH